MEGAHMSATPTGFTAHPLGCTSLMMQPSYTRLTSSQVRVILKRMLLVASSFLSSYGCKNERFH